MAYSVVNSSIAGVAKDGYLIGAFKLAHIYAGEISQVVWENIKGVATAKRDDDGEIIRKEVDGFTLHFQYKNTAGSWSGTVLTDDNGEVMTKGCLRLDIALPKQLNEQSKLYQFLVLLGVIEPSNFTVDEESLIDDQDDVSQMSLEDLETDSDEEIETGESLTLEQVYEDLSVFHKRIFTAPFTKNEKGYPVLEKDFSKWKLVEKKSK